MRVRLEAAEREGVQLRQERDRLIREAVDEGFSYRQIAELLGKQLSFQRVAQVTSEPDD